MGKKCEISNAQGLAFTHIGLSAPERGVPGNPLELVYGGLVNRRGRKKGKTK